MKFGRAQDRRFAIEKVRLPLVALIDVVLFLLLYFVMAGTLAPQETELPSALKTEKQAAGPGADLQPQILYVESSAGQTRYRLGERAVSDRGALEALLKHLPREAGVTVRVAPEVQVQAAAAALQACRNAGFEKVSYVAQK
jgi:biopolymer transport protein ExbD